MFSYELLCYINERHVNKRTKNICHSQCQFLFASLGFTLFVVHSVSQCILFIPHNAQHRVTVRECAHLMRASGSISQRREQSRYLSAYPAEHMYADFSQHCTHNTTQHIRAYRIATCLAKPIKHLCALASLVPFFGLCSEYVCAESRAALAHAATLTNYYPIMPMIYAKTRGLCALVMPHQRCERCVLCVFETTCIRVCDMRHTV